MHARLSPPIAQAQSKKAFSAAQFAHSTSIYHEPANTGKINSFDHPTYRGQAKNEADRIISKKSQSHGRAVTCQDRKCSVNNGRWTSAEHDAFLQGLKVYGREWKKVATCIPTRTSAQIRSHAQKYFAKVNKEQKHFSALTEKRRLSFPNGMPFTPDGHFLRSGKKTTQHCISTMNSITEKPSEAETRVRKTLASLRERYKQLEDQLQQVQASDMFNPSFLSGGVALGPASAALEFEQKSLRKAAEARHEMKKLESQPNKIQSSRIATVTNSPSRARVSLVSMPSQGGFDSSDVIALSILGCNLGREKIENQRKETTTINTASS